MSNKSVAEEVVETVIKLSNDQREHPYAILLNLVKMYDFMEHKEKQLIAECKMLLRYRHKELVWRLV